MQKLDFVDETLDINLSKTYRLSIQASLNGFSFCVLDPVRNKYVALKYIPLNETILEEKLEKLENYLAKEELLQLSYKGSHIQYATNKVTLVPQPYFKTGEVKNFFQYNQQLNELDELHYGLHTETSSYIIYAVPNLIANIITKKFEGINFYSHGHTFLHDIMQHADRVNHSLIHMNIHTDFVDIAITDKKQLLFYNTFTYQNEEELVFYLLQSMNRFNLEPGKQEIWLSGFIRKRDHLDREIRSFVPHVKYRKPSEDYTYSYTFASAPMHWFTNILNHYSCV